MEGKNTSKVFSRKNFEVRNPINFPYAPAQCLSDSNHRPQSSEIMLCDPQKKVPNEMLISMCSTQDDSVVELKDLNLIVNYSTEDDEENILNFSSNVNKAKIFDFSIGNEAVPGDKTGLEKDKKSQEIYIENDEDEKNFEVIIPSKRKNSKKIEQAPCKKLNKLVDVSSDIVIDPEATKCTDEIEITVDKKQRVFNNSFLDKFKQRKSESFSAQLAKGVFTGKTEQDFLEISAPRYLKGFTIKPAINNPRDLFRQTLLSKINNKKTNHISSEDIFSKSVTEFNGKPYENNKLTTLAMEKINESSEVFTKNSLSSYESNDFSRTMNDKSLDFSPLAKKNKELEIFRDSPFSKIDLSPFTKNNSYNLSCLSTTENTPSSIKNFCRPKDIRMFIENEAELGSDHEEHDDFVRKIKESNDDDKIYENDLEDLIDKNSVEDNQDIVYEKYLSQLISNDEKQFKKIANAEFKDRKKHLSLVEGTMNSFNLKQKIIESKLKNFEELDCNEDLNKNKDNKLEDDMDEEEYNKYMLIKNTQKLKFVRSRFTPKMELDEKSLSFLGLIAKPQNSVISRSLISCSEKNESSVMSIEGFSSNGSFVFSKDDDSQNIYIRD